MQSKSIQSPVTLWCNNTTLNGKKLEDGTAITMEGKNAKLFTAFNETVDEMNASCTYDWTENHTSEDGRFEIADNKYQLTTSCYFNIQGKLESITLQLLLDDNTLEPTAIALTLGGRNGDEGSKTFTHTLAVFEMIYDGGIKDIADLINNTISVKFLRHHEQAAELKIKPSSIDTKWIASAYALSADGKAKDVKVIGFNADSAKSMMVLSYKVNGAKQVSETSIAHYLHDYNLQQGNG